MTNLQKQYYAQPQIIDTPIGNNAFSFTERQQQDSSCIIHTPTIKSISIEDFLQSGSEILGDTIVFEEIDERGKIHSCTGLKHIYQLENKDKNKKNEKPLYVMDNHNHALYLRTLAYHQKRLGAGAMLIHIDQHADMGQPTNAIQTTLQGEDILSYTAQFANESCNVGNFITPAQEIGLIDEVTQIRTVTKLVEYNTTNSIADITENTHSILDIDIDFFVDHEPSDQELHALKILYQNCKVCTIALSPYFIDIKKSSQIAKRIINFCLGD